VGSAVKGLTILALCPLASAGRTGKYRGEAILAAVMGNLTLDPLITSRKFEKISPLVNLLRQIGENYDRTPTQAALNWLIG
jgi:aryl-alcohol dehydrogenase-like predicted oxidoreductase